jgi:hypothetical protein
MHTDPTLGLLDNTTTGIGAQFRKFADNTCAAFDTRELKRENEARKRRQSKKAKKGKGSRVPTPEPSATASEDLRYKKFTLQTYKYHALGDYVDIIRRYGTTDSFSTETVRSQIIQF